MANFRSVFTLQYVAILFFSVLISSICTLLVSHWKDESNLNIQEIRIVNNQNKTLGEVKMDSLSILKLQNSIDLISQKNDGRFEVLGWGAALLISIFVAFLTFNAIVSTGKVRELVDSEIEKKSASLETQLSTKLTELNTIVLKAEDELNTLRTIVQNTNP